MLTNNEGETPLLKGLLECFQHARTICLSYIALLFEKI